MKYFIVTLTYLESLDRVAEVVDEHRAYLAKGYEKDWFLASGPQNPKVGGLIIARAPSREELESFLRDDPFQAKGVAAYSFTEFEPVKRHPQMAGFFEG